MDGEIPLYKGKTVFKVSLGYANRETKYTLRGTPGIVMACTTDDWYRFAGSLKSLIVWFAAFSAVSPWRRFCSNVCSFGTDFAQVHLRGFHPNLKCNFSLPENGSPVCWLGFSYVHVRHRA